MALERGTFQDLHPYRFLSFSFPNPSNATGGYGPSLRIAVLDSPSCGGTFPPADPTVAAMLVPIGREDDWIFSTEAGHHQLLSSSRVSRLILVGNLPRTEGRIPWVFAPPEKGLCIDAFQTSLVPLLLALSPRFLFRCGVVPSVPFLQYEDDVVGLSVIDESVGPVVGEMLIEDVEVLPREGLVKGAGVTEFRRRLRFKRMPNLVQTEVPLIKVSDSKAALPDLRRLVHPYLPPMVAGFSLVAPLLEECSGSGSRPRLLCIGVGGGALLGFLHEHFEFHVIGVEMDKVVLQTAGHHFGLVENEFHRAYVGDGIEWLVDLAQQAVQFGLASDDLASRWNQLNVSELGFGGENLSSLKNGALDCTKRESFVSGSCPLTGVDGSLVHVILIDVDSNDARTGLSAPPVEFVRERVVLACRLALHSRGILVINVIPPSKCFYNNIVSVFKKFFLELYEIEVGNGENYVLIAAASFMDAVDKDSFISKKLRQIIENQFFDQIRKI
ncbi:Methyltransferase-like protein 13 [Nymphaea thermarum]|nr:Methyltransferase-like protein 13 [Nymphaea thermarum]